MFEYLKRKLKQRYSEQLRKNLNLDTERDIVLLGDHCIEANSVPQDNYYMFLYLMECGQTEYRPYYVMNSQCPIYAEASEKYGEHIIPYESGSRKFKFKMLSLMKQVKIVCDSYQIFNHIIPSFALAVKNSPYVYSIFTQHGITYFKDQFINGKSYGTFMFDQVTVCNEFEKDIFKTRGLFQEQNIISNGLFRWDYIKPQYDKKTIFVFFTYRRYLTEIPNIEESMYFKTISSIIKKLLSSTIIQSSEYKIKVALHHSVVDKFGYELLKGIEIVKDEEIEQVKSEANVLITDYSAMCFEVWHQYKPVLFLHIHDIEDCLKYKKTTDLVNPYAGKEQYLCNIFEYTKECVERVEDYVCNGFTLTEKEINSRNLYFYYNSDYRKRFAEYIYAIKKQSKDWYKLPLNELIYFNQFADIFTEGLDMINPTGRWTVKKKASIAFSLPDCKRELCVKICGMPNIVSGQKKLPVKIFANGTCVKETVFSKREKVGITFTISPSMLVQNNYLKIELQFSHCKMQKDLYPNCADIRYFGMNLETIMITEKVEDVKLIKQPTKLEVVKIPEKLQPLESVNTVSFYEHNKTTIYKKIYQVMNETALDADVYFNFYADVFAYNAISDNRTVDIMELLQCKDNKAFTQLAYLMLLRRLPDEGALRGLEKQYSLKSEEFQTKLITRILASQEFKNSNIKIINNRYPKGIGTVSSATKGKTAAQKAKPVQKKKGVKTILRSIGKHQPKVLKNIEKKILRMMGIKW